MWWHSIRFIITIIIVIVVFSRRVEPHGAHAAVARYMVHIYKYFVISQKPNEYECKKVLLLFVG